MVIRRPYSVPYLMRSTKFIAALLAVASCLTDAPHSVAFQGQVDKDTVDDCRRLAQTFVREVHEGDVGAASDRVDWAGILEEAMRGVPENGPGADVRRQFSNQFLQGLKKSGGLVAQVAEVVRQGGGYKLLRIQETSPVRAVVRLLPPGGGVNYHTFYFGKNAQGEVRILDIGVAVSGERLSETLRRGFLSLLAQSSQDFSPYLSETERFYMKHLDDLRAMAEALGQEELGRVDGLYDELPAALQQDHGVLMLRLQAARSRGESEFAKALETTRQAGGDPLAAELFAIDAWMQLERPDAALDSIDRIDAAVGGDPYLQVMRADVHYRAGELEAAERAAKAAIDADPDLQDAYWQLTTISLDLHNFAMTANMLTRIGQRFDIEFQDLRDLPEYNEFVRSPEYRAWKRSQSR